jgi:hypothetical protein
MNYLSEQLKFCLINAAVEKIGCGANSQIMQISLEIKQPSQFFWVRKIRSVDISRCCAKCFIGESDTRLYHGTAYGQTPRFIKLEIEPAEKYVAYYLCGLSAGFKYEKNTHLAFIHAPGERVHVESEQMEVTIENTRWIDFEGADYTPNPRGEYTDEQRMCRNWIFANFIRDGMIGNAGGDDL